MIQKCNVNKKKILNGTRNILEGCYCNVSSSNKIQLNHHYIIQGCHQALDEQGNKLVLKPYITFEFGQGKKKCRLQLKIFQCLNKLLGRRKDPRELETIGAMQRNYMNHQAKKRCEFSLTLFYYCFNYNKLHVHQCIRLRYQCIKYRCIYNIICFNVLNFVYQCKSQQVKRIQTLRWKPQNK